MEDLPHCVIAANREDDNVYYLVAWKPNASAMEILTPNWIPDWMAEERFPNLIFDYMNHFICQTI